jgi:hypothetical protein
MFAGQQPYRTWPQALPPPDDPGPGARGTESIGAKPNGVSSGGVRSYWPLIVVGLVAVALVAIGFLGTVMLRPRAAPETAAVLPPTVAVLPPLVSPAPSLTEDAANSPREAIEPERLSGPEPAPIQIGVSHEAGLEAAPTPASTTLVAPPLLPRVAALPDVLTPLPPPRPLGFEPLARPATGYDSWTAVYDISAHTVYLPYGTRLEAHSGLGDRLDDPRYVDERDRGATPPHLYELTLRESLFHGVQALRLNPIGGGFSFNRVGLLAHPYMLGPNGDSNGCVSFKDYDAFLRAFQSGEVKRLAVVAQWTEEPRQTGRFASLQRLDR